jgi:hypothetical protein
MPESRGARPGTRSSHVSGISSSAASRPLARWVTRIGPILIVLGLVVGTEAFLGSQRSVASTGSGLCQINCFSASTVAGKLAGGATGSSASGSGSGGSGSAASGAAGSGSAAQAAGTHDPAGSLALTGNEVVLLVLLALALFAGGLILVRMNSQRQRPR